MPICRTARRHFLQDVGRATELLNHARIQPNNQIRNDILRASWMMAVGACDAYFSDAYGDFIARTLRAKSIETAIPIPDRLNNLRVPVITVIRSSSTEGWRWRMAARGLIEYESVLSLDKIRQLFNHFFRKNFRPLTKATIETWVLHRDAKVRLFGFSPTQFRNSPNPELAKEDALEHFEKHYQEIFQRRHDCIHNCDRPRVAILAIDDVTVEKVIYDVKFLVERCHESFLSEFPIYIDGLGFSAITRNNVCM